MECGRLIEVVFLRFLPLFSIQQADFHDPRISSSSLEWSQDSRLFLRRVLLQGFVDLGCLIFLV